VERLKGAAEVMRGWNPFRVIHRPSTREEGAKLSWFGCVFLVRRSLIHAVVRRKKRKAWALASPSRLCGS